MLSSPNSTSENLSMIPKYKRYICGYIKYINNMIHLKKSSN